MRSLRAMARYGFPEDLVQLQRDWLRTHEALARCSPAVGTTALRRRLIVESCRVARHPFWSETGRSPAMWGELRRAARAEDGRWDAA
ncbi:hypothetical protein ACFVY9_15995 [Streptomyces sp. NPDC059544]|uniref:hypothetical protein n=1 Tax=Streptomyces sp. NPDC059544 TaxID=3346861 RepID=UPI0036B6961E